MPYAINDLFHNIEFSCFYCAMSNQFIFLFSFGAQLTFSENERYKIANRSVIVSGELRFST